MFTDISNQFGFDDFPGVAKSDHKQYDIVSFTITNIIVTNIILKYAPINGAALFGYKIGELKDGESKLSEFTADVLGDDVEFILGYTTDQFEENDETTQPSDKTDRPSSLEEQEGYFYITHEDSG